MGRPYGVMKRKTQKKAGTPKDSDGVFRIRIRAADGSYLSVQELRDGLYEAVRRLQLNTPCRAKWATLSLVMIDEDGKTVMPDPSGEWEIRSYKSAADEHGV